MGLDAYMAVVLDREPTAKELKRWTWELRDCFDRATDGIGLWDGWPELPPGAQGPGQAVLLLGLGGRYYGKGYERGNLPQLVAIAEWCERRIPGLVAIWYGGDSLSQTFGRAEREELFAHFCEHGHRPYHRYPDPDGPICAECDEPGCVFGWGPGRRVFRCLGCDTETVRFDDGTVRVVTPGQDKWEVKP